jgi:SAM-dependent methyltransferase
VGRGRHGLLRKLLETFHAKTGCPVMINTSFNLGWEPIVSSPRDAYETFMSSDIDMLCLGKFILTKESQPATVSAAHSSDGVITDRFISPCCQAGLTMNGDNMVCESCEHSFSIIDKIPQLFWPHENIDDAGDVTEMVKAFYEETPFPNYDDHDSVRSLIEKSRRGLYARRLDETIPHNTTVLEVGCGTGQLTNFLGMSCRQVIGTDMCVNSLGLGEAFRREHGLTRIQFAQMNLFRPCLKPEQFDVLLCNGVLHHTADPYGGFKGLVPLVKPGGHLIIGLYNTYGRLFTDMRRGMFRLTGGRAKWVDPVLRRSGMSDDKRRAWFADQYRHPHESKHTFGEILGWFEENDVEFVRGVPAMRPEDNGLDGTSLFEPQPRGSKLEHFLVEAMEIFGAGQKEGGFFIMIGRKAGGADRDLDDAERAWERLSVGETNVVT